jgi:hypothetical protein
VLDLSRETGLGLGEPGTPQSSYDLLGGLVSRLKGSCLISHGCVNPSPI